MSSQDNLLFQPDGWLEVIKSSNIIGVGKKDHFLIVLFKNGAIYRYPNSQHMFLMFKHHKGSIGKLFHSLIRKNNRQHQKLCSNGCWEQVVTIQAGLCKKCAEDNYRLGKEDIDKLKERKGNES